ncbi:hypothetical protein BDF14DRAFT_1809533 [Spinellus fusiger]|nr:hypothetical protein BDF14DRAFT_1809533 [Spinellus fusiger]
MSLLLNIEHTSDIFTQTVKKSIANQPEIQNEKNNDSTSFLTRPDSPTLQTWDQGHPVDSSQQTNLLTPPSSPVTAPVKSDEALFDINANLLAIKRNGNLKAVMSEFEAMKKRSTPLTHYTYDIVLEAHAILRREGFPLSHMFKVYNEMCINKIVPSTHTYSILLRALCRRDVEVQKTIAMLKRQSNRAGVQHKKDITLLESEKNICKAMTIFRKAGESTNEFEVDVFNQLLRVLSHYSNTKEAMFVYERLEHSSASPNASTFAALINLFGRARDLPSSLLYFEIYKKRIETLGHHDSSYLYNALVDAYLKCDNPEGALQVVEQDMTEQGVKLAIIPFNSIIRHYCSIARMSDAEALIGKLESQPELPCPDASSYGPILSAYCQIGDASILEAASRVYKNMIKTDISKAYGNLANYCFLCLSLKHTSMAIRVIDEMRLSGLTPDPLLSERVVLQCVSEGDVSRSIKALDTVIQSMSQKMLFKGSGHLFHTAYEVMNSAKQYLRSSLDVVHAITPLCSSGLPMSLAILLTESFSSDQECLLEAKDYVVLCDSALMLCSKQNSYELFRDILSRMPEDYITGALPSTLISRIWSCLESSGQEDILNLWKHQLNTCSESLPLLSESTVLSQNIMAAIHQGHMEKATEILKNMVAIDEVPVPEVMRDAIALTGKQGCLDVSLVLYNLSLDAYKNLDLESQNKAIHMATNSILIGYAQQGNMLEAKKYYEELKTMGCFPDGNGYASLLLGSAQCATDEATDALMIYDEAKRHGVKPTTFFYNVILSRLSKARKLDNVLNLFEEMCQFKVPANGITHGTIIAACVRAGSEHNARHYFNQMLSCNYQLRVGPFNHMMQFYVRQQPDRMRVLNYFKEMRCHNVKPSSYTYKLLIEAYASIAPYDMPMAHRMLQDMAQKDNLQPQATHYATLIYAYGTLQRDLQSAERVFDGMKKAKIHTDETVYQAILDTLISHGELARAETIYKSMTKKSTSPYIENLFIRGYGAHCQIHKAEAVFKAMSDDKLGVNKNIVVREPSTFEAMVRAYLNSGMIAEARHVLDLMVQRDFPEKVVAAVTDLMIE